MVTYFFSMNVHVTFITLETECTVTAQWYTSICLT